MENMENRYTFYTAEKIEQARLAFKRLVINGPKDGDNFFAVFCPGNTINFTDRPYERFEDYEKLLTIIRDDDQIKYEKIHKGTPFYFLAWTAFDMKNYEKAVFYMDAAISEDERKDLKGWMNHPAGQFLTLNDKGNQIALRITKHLNDKILIELSRFNNVNGFRISIEDFVEKFVKIFIQKKNTTR